MLSFPAYVRYPVTHVVTHGTAALLPYTFQTRTWRVRTSSWCYAYAYVGFISLQICIMMFAVHELFSWDIGHSVSGSMGRLGSSQTAPVPRRCNMLTGRVAARARGLRMLD